ncbi:MAG: UDP-N-acetylmuramoyl-L-alanyl-D-glutamate--2,6-diaminopimelate ligase [Desulfobulbaceae bacterium]|uniref:Multifunctional fusion protein n=1 Tax=Candidatus Desulfatifera sulfidica TaxID=2841691 RepID=A0A8J6NB42_9BACT|nr:UDP-N-acetylmuramoyl-L-alanyl-D-glutamate--2,6-diaminopimelate ligase [Candidatus Desulfatifera sulfidica]
MTADSRLVTPGALFVAMAGERSDGHHYLDDVFEAGCAAVLVESERMFELADVPPDCCVIAVSDSCKAYAQIAANYYGQPAREMCLVGITGTNGKTTVSYLLESIFAQAGRRVGVIGTVSYRYRDESGREIETPAPYTTPEPLMLQKLLAEMHDAGVETVVMEVSSHALAQQRLGGVLFDVVAFTNLSRDHLDYHLDIADYFSAKRLLFTKHLKKGGWGVITRSSQPAIEEEERARTLRQDVIDACGRVLECGRRGESDIFPLAVSSGVTATTVKLHGPWENVVLKSPLAGDFNVSNIQTALAVGEVLEVNVQYMVEALAKCQGAPGRLERVVVPELIRCRRPAVFVDYAHTPDALEQVLSTLSALPHRRVGLVFGCGGDRDRGKRPLMGEAAARWADWSIVTDDNPRSEDPQVIVEEIKVGITSAGMNVSVEQNFDPQSKTCQVIHDRTRAIATAVSLAGPEDLVLIAGKGHEQMQITRSGRRYFDDREQVRDALLAWTPELIQRATNGVLVGETVSRPLGPVTTDSRNLQPHAIFVALVGDRFDGHDFLEQVVEQGAGCLVINRNHQNPPVGRPCVLVDDTQQALGDLAGFRRRLFQDRRVPVVGITGSCGKTSVKEMVAAIFERHWLRTGEGAPSAVLKTQGNFNNLIGLPLSLLPVHSGHRAVILEMGMNRPGEISRLAEIAAPDIACITNIHAAHLEGLGSIENVALAKEELFAASGPETILVVNYDDPRVRMCGEKYLQKKISYAVTEAGLRYNPLISAFDVRGAGPGRLDFTLQVSGEKRPVSLSVPGIHNVSNAIAAAAIARAAGVCIDEIVAGLEDFDSVDKRMQLLRGRFGLTLMNDCYNANPASMAAALATLAEEDAVMRLAVLGDMLEMGAASVESHQDLGRQAVELGLDYLVLVGQFAHETSAGAMAAGMPADRILVAADHDQIVVWLKDLAFQGILAKGAWLLIKGSRGMKLERLVAQLLFESED